MSRIVPPAAPPLGAGVALAAQDPLSTTLIAGRYEVLAPLGSGAMGIVYKVRDRELGEIVALKLLRPELLGAEYALERFRREVRLARLVTHSNVARTFDIGEHQGQRFLTMEFLTGRSLAQRLALGALPFSDALAMVQKICAGLTAAHQAGVVHRDLKPENIMLCDDGRVVITDFGIARGHSPPGPGEEGPRSHMQTVGAVGTPAYMAPEQVNQSSTPDARTDLYALGCLLFELFTGQLPWPGSSLTEILRPRTFNDPPDPRAVQPDLPDTVVRVILRCLAREPAGRPHSASEVASALLTATLPLPAESLIEDCGAEVELATKPRPRPEPPPASPLGDAVASPAVTLPTEARWTQGGQALAVLPFRNDGLKEDDYLAAGLTEDLIDSLSTVRGLRTRSRSAVLAYRDPDRDPQQAGQALGVEVVAEGSLRRTAAGLRVQLRVINVADGFQLWAKRFEGPLGDMLTVCDDMAQAIAHALTAQSLKRKREGPSDPQAMDLYLRARHEFHQPDRLNALHAAVLFAEALALCPQDPVLLSAYALARARLWFFGGEGAEALAHAAATQALALAPTRGESHLALGVIRFQSGDFLGAVRALRDALRLSPMLAEAYEYLGRILTETGPIQEGMGYLHDALTLEPELSLARVAMARAYGLQSEWEKAEHELELHQGPNDRAALWVTRARLCLWRGDTATAQRLLLHPDVNSGRFPAVQQLLELVIGGAASHASRSLKPLFSGSGSERSRAFLLQLQTEILVYVGDVEGALATLQGVEQVEVIDLLWMDLCPLLAVLRQDPRFAPLREVVAARAAQIHAGLRG